MNCSTGSSKMSRSACRRFWRRVRACTPIQTMSPRRYEVLQQGIADYPDNVDLRYARGLHVRGSGPASPRRCTN